MRGYYVGRLSGERLRQCYGIVSERVKRYLEAEIDFVLRRLERNNHVLELGCGYGRVTFRLAEVAKRVVGIDTATESLALARQIADPTSPCEFQEMDALELTFDTSEFDRVVCVQNGICAFGGNQDVLLHQALRVTRPGGRVLFSTYSQRFWPHRLEWFAAQAAVGLVGPIDYERTGNGAIICKDGFHSGTVSTEAFLSLGKRLGVKCEVTEVDESSVFCEFVVPGTA